MPKSNIITGLDIGTDGVKILVVSKEQDNEPEILFQTKENISGVRKGVVIDAIYMNPPLRQGREDFLNLCKDIPSVLKSGGTFQFVIRKKMGASFILNHLEKTFPRNTLDINILCKRSGYWVFELRFY